MTIGKKWVCQNCQQRTHSCHGTCARYLEEKAQMTAAREKRLNEMMIVGDYISQSVYKTKGKPGGHIKNCRPKGAR